MKTKFILTAFIGVLSSAGIASAQQSEQPVIVGNSAHVRETERTGSCCTISEVVITKNLDSSTGGIVRLRFAQPVVRGPQTYGLEFLGGVVVGASRDAPTETISFYYNDIEYQDTVQFFEAVIPATTREECLESTDFSNAVPIGPDRARMTYDPETTTNTAILQFAMHDGSVRSRSCRAVLAVRPGGSVDSAAWRVSEWKYTPVRR